MISNKGKKPHGAIILSKNNVGSPKTEDNRKK